MRLCSSPVVLLACFGLAISAVHAGGTARTAYGKQHPFRAEELPDGKLKTGLQALDPQAKEKAMKWLHTFDFSDSDAAESLRVDNGGGVFIVCPDTEGKSDGKAHGSAKPGATQGNSGETGGISPAPDQTAEESPPVASAAVSVSSPPVYHSKPGSTKHIYLDFNGGIVTGTAWNNNPNYGSVASWNVKVWSQDSDVTTFNDAEQTWMKRVWERVAEDYAPFDVDVTTDAAYDPDTYTGNKDYVGWVLICETTDNNGLALPHNGSGGVAYVGVFGNANYSPTYQPAWVTSTNGGGNESIIAEAASHEMGHNMGLSHDGTSPPAGDNYYGGHGTGDISWGPIMGTGYNRNVSQWSKGEYYSANNTEDDLSIISGRVSYRADDHGNTLGTATALTVTGGTTISSTTPETDPTNANPANKGVIERNTDVDIFSFYTGAGNVQLNANPWIQPAGTRGGNLDILLELYDQAGTLVTSNNSTSLTNATISAALAQGTYYLYVRNTGTGTPLVSPPSGYTVYGSIGQYFISGTIVNPGPPVPPSNLTATPGNNSVSLSWSAVTDATSYKVKRSTTSGGPYTTVGTPTSTSYSDVTVINGTTYYYVVSSVNTNGEGANSAQVSATPAPVASTTTLASSLGSSGTYGTSVTFTATVSGGIPTPTGSVSFYDGASLLGTGSLNGSGQATLSTSTLAVGGHSITASYGGNLIYGPSNSLAFSYTVSPKPVTITGVTAGNKVYDATTVATLSGGVVSGVVSGETVNVVPGTGAFDSSNAGTRNVTASGYAINGPNAGNYVLSAQPAPPAAVIAPRPLQLSGIKTYDGTSNVNSSNLVVSNNLDGANLTMTGFASLVGMNAGLQSFSSDPQTSRVQIATGNTGTNSAASFNVTLGSPPVSGNTMIAVISTRGSASGTVTSITQSGATWTRAFQATNSNGVTTEIWYAPGVSNAGTSITINQGSVRSAAVVMEYSGLLAAGALDQTAASTGTGTAAVTGTTALTSQARELWIGAIGVSGSTPTISSILNGFSNIASSQSTRSSQTNTNAKVFALEELITSTGNASSGGTVNSSVTWAGSVATFKSVVSSALVLSGSASGNYTTEGMTGSVSINPKPLVWSGVSAVDREYDGGQAVALTGSPVLSSSETAGAGTAQDGKPYTGDVLSLSGTPVGSYANKHAGSSKPVSVSGVTLGGTDAGNYTLFPLSGLTGNVLAKALTVTAVEVSKTYDGSTSASGTPTLSQTLQSGDMVGLLVQEFLDGSAGEGTKVLIPSIVINDGNGGANYAVTLVNCSTGTIHRASATVALGNLLATYNGSPVSATASTTPAGLAVNLTYNGSPTPPTNADSYAVTATVTDPNYQGSTSASLVIAKASAAVSLGGLAQTYDGTPKPVTVTTTPGGLTTSITYDASTMPPSAVGSYQIVATITDPNYEGSATGTLVIATSNNFSTWQEAHFTQVQQGSGQSDPNADPDADGLVNLAEYALGTDPLQFTPPLSAVKDVNGLTLTFTRPANLPDVTYKAEVSDGLGTWNEIPLEVIGVGDPETVRGRDPLSSGNPTKRFIRLRFTRD